MCHSPNLNTDISTSRGKRERHRKDKAPDVSNQRAPHLSLSLSDTRTHAHTHPSPSVKETRSNTQTDNQTRTHTRGTPQEGREVRTRTHASRGQKRSIDHASDPVFSFRIGDVQERLDDVPCSRRAGVQSRAADISAFVKYPSRVLFVTRYYSEPDAYISVANGA